jgi:hypothetical protein
MGALVAGRPTSILHLAQTPERSNAERLDCDASDDHHLYGVDRVFHEMKKQGAA